MLVAPVRPDKRLLAELRGAVRRLARRSPTAGSATLPEADAMLARAQLAKAALTEEYRYKQEVSRNHNTSQIGEPTGHIRFELPYDGDRYFTRAAMADIARQARWMSESATEEAQVGHLLLADYQRTSLDDVLRLTEHYDSVPILVPVSDDGHHGDTSDGLDHLGADERTCVTTHDYRIDPLREFPVSVNVELFDPDSLYSIEADNDVPAQPELIAQHATFQPFLLLSIDVVVTLPNVQDLDPNPVPVVKRVSIDWPTITSLEALTLYVGADKLTHAITYNPLRRCIEWSDVPMPIVRVSDNGMTVSHHSRAMVLCIEQPGELYRQLSIGGEVEIEIPGWLLSGTRAQLYDGHGRPDPEPLTVCSRVLTRLELVLDDAFSRRDMKPYQLLHFDEIIPDKMRFTDIDHALKDRGFIVDQKKPIDVTDGKQFIVAKRPAGPATMWLFLYIEGARYETERKKQTGGDTYTSKMESGELKIHMSGELAGDSRLLTHEMNVLQRALREKFVHLQSRH